jgi:hypothetical protein
MHVRDTTHGRLDSGAVVDVGHHELDVRAQLVVLPDVQDPDVLTAGSQQTGDIRSDKAATACNQV